MEQPIDNPVLRMDEWLECTGMAPEIAETFGRLYFVCGDTVFTSHRRGTSFCEKACLPAYPLALWIAQCWWRLFYEPKPESSSYTWGTAHCMRSAGYGFLWPDVWLQSDGVFVDIQAHDYKADPKEPLEYFGHELCRIPLERAEVCLSDFVDSVVARVGDTKPEFKELWSEVLKERQSDTLAFMRKIEAALGCDPDDISEEMLQALAGNAQDLGRTNLLEVLASAPRTEAPDTKAATEMLCGVMHSKGVHGRFNLPAMPSDVSLSSPSQPWELGRSMANQLRRQAGIDGKIDNKTLREMIELSENDFNSNQISSQMPLACGAATAENEYSFTFLKDRMESRRFQIARFIGDYCAARFGQQNARWLIVSDCSTFRQKMQRAFGAELLLPVRLIKEYTEEQYTPGNVKKVAAEFEVSPMLAATQLINHKLISQSDFELYC